MEQLDENMTGLAIDVKRTIITAPKEPRTSPWFSVGESHVITKGGTYYIEFQFRIASVDPRPLRFLQSGVELTCFINDQSGRGKKTTFDLRMTEVTVGETFTLGEGDKFEYRIRKEYGNDLTLVLEDLQITVLELVETGPTPLQVEIEDEYE
jgi:hypothetical protein